MFPSRTLDFLKQAEILKKKMKKKVWEN